MLNAADGRSSICGGVHSYFIYCFAEVERFLPHPLPFIQPHLIRDHCNELRVGGLPSQVVDGIAEVAVEGIHVAAVPRHLDGMADGALHPAGGGAVFLGDLRVQALCHCVDVLRLVHSEKDGVPQELIPLDVGRDVIREGQ